MQDIKLTNLPDLALNGITEYLQPKDIIHLCDSSPCFEDLRRFLPKYQDITVKTLKKVVHMEDGLKLILMDQK